ncbi:hypothetical protein [Streptacidiphilus sp. P02-A3a]|uniref:hypothetical protein n=1 Tax=Streptacidiphilus sp. P02-A3a TaxID=2704468 RepID=UPI0015FA68DF|nr:hypothetical protein [Streptacidiphilus sp. P02-A3a]QMU70078.1 hypothetical protein GXP74_19445 [Streptacidiphilus sp. P02-A3a]
MPWKNFSLVVSISAWVVVVPSVVASSRITFPPWAVGSLGKLIAFWDQVLAMPGPPEPVRMVQSWALRSGSLGPV